MAGSSDDAEKDSCCVSSEGGDDNTDDYSYDDNDDDDEYSYTYTCSGETSSALKPNNNNNSSSAARREFFCSQDDSNNNAAGVAPPAGGCRFWRPEQVRRTMRAAAHEVADLLCVPPEAAAALLGHHRWDSKRLYAAYYYSAPAPVAADAEDADADADDDEHNNSARRHQQKILTECGVLCRCTAHSNNNNNKSTGNAKKAPSSGRCPICFDDDLPGEALFAMECGHEFCKDCWGGYIAEAVSQGPQCVLTQCPDPGCTEIVTLKEVSQLATTDEITARFQDFQLRSYVQTNYLMRWCPGPACDQVAVGSSADGLVGEGECGQCRTRFCLQCGEMRHTPATCAMMALWREKCRDESETANWMLAKTKKCPKCQTRIDKNGGCAHMTCSQCRHEFCWQCMQDWAAHGYNRSCNAFELDQAQAQDSARAGAERELERYLHCFHRHQNHAQGQNFAQEQLEKFARDQDDRERGDSSFDWDALRDALRQLVECRLVLKYTYVVTYCLGDQPVQRALFEDHQGLLESFTERLSEITEKDYKSIDRTELVNLTGVVVRYTKNVMECEIDEAV